ncbi:MAG: hypothetical protein U0800_24990 [Isosphaeraceae bacterium]
MLTRSRRFWIGATAIALAWVLGHSNSGQAQLFPNLPIQRPKVPCDQEAPIYNLVRQNYYGYFPTCWRKFPPGWTCPCPNPEKPDYEASKAKIPLQKDPDTFLQPGAGMGLGGDEDLPPGPGNRPGRDAGPALPDGRRSPFDLDGPAANPAGGRNPAGRPFDMPPGGAAARRQVRPAAALPRHRRADDPRRPHADGQQAPRLDRRLAPIPDPAVGPTSASPGSWPPRPGSPAC